MKRPYFFQHILGYTKNPFGALTREEWTAVTFLPTPLHNILTAKYTHLQLLGRQGCGKSSALLNIMEQFRQQNKPAIYEYIPNGQKKWHSNLTGISCFFLDEAQRLNGRQRRRWLKTATKTQLIFSSHQDLSKHFHKRHLPLHTFNIETLITPDYYAQWIEKRLTYFALDVPERVTFADTAVSHLFHTYGPNIREAEYFLYDVWQSLTEPQILTEHTLKKLLN